MKMTLQKCMVLVSLTALLLQFSSVTLTKVHVAQVEFSQEIVSKNSEQERIVFIDCLQGQGIHGINQIRVLGQGRTDIYLNNVLWSALVILGCFSTGLLIGLIPHMSLALDGFISTVGGSVAAGYLTAKQGVILRTEHAYLPSTQVSGSKYINRIVSIREQEE